MDVLRTCEKGLVVTEPIIIGCDPSSRKLAVVITQGSELLAVRTVDFPPKQPAETCFMAYAFIQGVVRDMQNYGMDLSWSGPPKLPNEVYVYVEAPVFVPRAGAGSLIPQAQVSGAILAACMVRGAPVELVPNKDWKKVVVGKGDASKVEIRRWAMKFWRKLWLASHADQDVLDAGGVNRYGAKMVQHIQRLQAEQAVPAKRLRRTT